MILQTRARALDLAEPRIIGIINVTPDSFSDGGKFLTPEAAIARAERLVEDGADILDVGGESTRPGAEPVSEKEELRRVGSIVELLAQRLPSVPISVDTTKAAVARRCLDAGASIVNDVSGLAADPAMVDAVREHGVPVIVMHRQGDPRTMQLAPKYDDVVAEIRGFFEERLAFCVRSGVPLDRIVLDPGIGFGKTFEHNLEVLRRLPELAALGRPLAIGTSRKAFLGAILREKGGEAPPAEARDAATVASCLWSVAQGARLLRVHEARGLRDALKTWRAIAIPAAGC